MNQNDRAGAVGVSVRLGRPSVRGPPRVTDSSVGFNGLFVQQLLKVGELANSTSGYEGVVLNDGHTGRVVPPVL